MNSDWDPQKEYIPRTERSEWVAVGTIGQTLARDDGSCTVHGYCCPNTEGIATSSDKGYLVLKRTGENQILILLKNTSILSG
ncbi:peptidase G2 autoproteolytic cleavage domain-containing protein [Pontibacillus salicampi]|uniref:Peptidase G2 autoproteolytic cleavage domain-containing protein n=1 Tax=Pontibacillus salicampi TaxID=1449801 RepID=A0ABV6LU10_9BACI